MNENKTNTDKGFKVLLSIGLLGIITIVVLLFSNFFKDRFTHLEDYEYSYSLKPGFIQMILRIQVLIQ